MAEIRWLEPDWGFNFPQREEMGEPPANLKRVEATGQNTLVLQDGEPVIVRPPNIRGRSQGGPAVWQWQLLNIGPGIAFVRWDGLGYAGPNDPHSLQLISSVGFSDIHANLLTFACVGATQVTFSVDNKPFQR